MCEKEVLDYFKQKYETRKNLKVTVNSFLQTAAASAKNLELYPGGKRIISYKAPPKIGKSKAPTPPYVPAITRYTRNKEDKTNNFAIFGDSSATEFTFTHPLIEYGKDGQIVRHYNDHLSVGDRLLIWQNIDSRGDVAHLTGHIITKDGKHYSVGFGFSGKKEYKGVIPTAGIKPISQFMEDSLGMAQGVIYTPDNVFEQKLLAQCTKSKGKFVRLISAIDITEQHLTNLRNSFDIVKNIERATLRFTMVPGGNQSEKTELIEKINTMISLGMYDKQYNDELNEFIAYVQQADAKYKCIYSIGYSLNFPMMYCRFSGKRSSAAEKSYNCASFLHNVFAESIDCGVLSYLVIDPSKCGAGSISQLKCNNGNVKMQNKQQKQEQQRLELQLKQTQERQLKQLLQKAQKAEKAPKAPKPPRVKKQKQQQNEQFFDAVQYL